MKNTPHAGKLNDIQWLRAVAALEVAIWHSDLVTKNFSTLSVTGLAWYRPLGGIGVELFFIVSGYVMCLRLPTYKSGAQFMYARFARLAPMYWFFTSLVIVVYLLHPAWRLNALHLDADSILRSYLMLPQRHYPILGVGWSLEIEMVFYAGLALALTAVGVLLRRPANNFNGIMYLLTAAGVTGFALGTGPVLRTWDYHLASPYMLMFAFGWAMCTADRSQTKAAWVKTFAAAVLVWLVALAVADPADRYLLFRMVFAAGVFILARVTRGLLQRDTVVNRAASAVGDASYSLYLSHWFVLSGMGKVLRVLHFSPAVDWTARSVGLAVAILFALACFRYAEGPLDRLLRPRTRRSQPMASSKDLSPARSGYFIVPLEVGTAAPNVAPSTQHDMEDGKWR